MPTVLSPTGRPIDCRDDAEAERVRAWVAWVHADRTRREYEAKQRQLEAEHRARSMARPQDYLNWRHGGTR